LKGTYETLVIMKKQQISTKLNFQKTFKALHNIIGGTLVNVDTTPIDTTTLSVKDTLEACRTRDEATCLTCTDTDCTRPTTRTNTYIDCGVGNDTKADCFNTGRC